MLAGRDSQAQGMAGCVALHCIALLALFCLHSVLPSTETQPRRALQCKSHAPSMPACGHRRQPHIYIRAAAESGDL